MAFSAERGSDGLQTSLQAGGQPSPGVRRGDVGDTERFCGGGPGSVRDGAQEYSAPAAAAGCRGGGYVVVVGRRERRTVGAETGQQPQDPQLVVGRGDQHRRRDTGPAGLASTNLRPDLPALGQPSPQRRVAVELRPAADRGASFRARSSEVDCDYGPNARRTADECRVRDGPATVGTGRSQHVSTG